MIKLYSIPTSQQLFNIAESISEELVDIRKENIYIVFELDKELLRQVDEDYFFKNNKDVSPSDFIPSDEVEVTVSDIKFKFIEKQNDNKEEIIEEKTD
jgi:hypothetical protein